MSQGMWCVPVGSGNPSWGGVPVGLGNPSWGCVPVDTLLWYAPLLMGRGMWCVPVGLFSALAERVY